VAGGPCTAMVLSQCLHVSAHEFKRLLPELATSDPAPMGNERSGTRAEATHEKICIVVFEKHARPFYELMYYLRILLISANKNLISIRAFWSGVSATVCPVPSAS
jgi:hypothetical protein